MNNDEITKRMNDNMKKPAKGKGKTPPKKGKKGLIIIILLVVIIGGAIAVVALNLFNFREGTLMPYLRNAPLVGGLFPPAEEESDEVPLEEMDTRQLANMIRALERDNEALQDQLSAAAERERADALLIARLRPFRDHWSEYQRVSAEFSAMVAHGDPDAFLNHVRYIMPEFYEQLARDAISLRDFDESVMSQVRTLSNMQERNAADVLVDLRITDIDLLVSILNAMSNSLRGAILDEMDAEIAAHMIRLISVPEPTLRPLAPALFTPPLPETFEDITPDEDYDDEDENGDDENGGDTE
ncbi:MAG: hypothetical protein FWD90_07785 [Defluviitaleaceae bacterium]|nr:hypothetical protein [Defluviitaleaceae bacterium]